MPTWRALIAVLVLSSSSRATYGVCLGDCNHDGAVTIDELVRGANVALGIMPLAVCPVLDRDDDGAVTVDELVGAVGTAVIGCPSEPTQTPTPTPSRDASAPMIPTLEVYRAYQGQPIRFPIPANDPDGDPLHYSEISLPVGAALDVLTGIFSWTPFANQVGPSYARFMVTDSEIPPQTASGVLAIDVAPLNDCNTLACDPANGCVTRLPDLDVSCCRAEPLVRVAEPVTACPQARIMFIGRNVNGFGRLQTCDRFRVVNFQQAGAAVRFHVEARCLNISRPVTLRARIETKQRLLYTGEETIKLTPRSDGYAEYLLVALPVGGPTPFFDLEGAEANFTLSLTDADGLTVSEQLRLTLTFTQPDDLPEVE